MGGGESSTTEWGSNVSQGTGAGSPGFDYSALGSGVAKGLGQYGSALSSGANVNYMKGTAGYDTPNIPGAATQQQYVGTQTGSMIPGGGQSLDLEAILRLLKGLG
jgi:hypothetical protein